VPDQGAFPVAQDGSVPVAHGFVTPSNAVHAALAPPQSSDAATLYSPLP
jgi:hypothetical protein